MTMQISSLSTEQVEINPWIGDTTTPQQAAGAMQNL